MRDEAGVVAIIVALSISTFLLGFAALAVDMGTLYVRKAELKSLAEKVALAGATGLPDIEEGLKAATATLGYSGSGGTPGKGLCATLDLPGVCDATATWANDGNDANGEITFYADDGQEGDLDDSNGDGQISALDKVTGRDAVGIHVLLPPSSVPFGFAKALGIDSASLQQTATARIGTPLGAGILPFPLGQADLTSGQFCVKDPLVASPANPFPGQTFFPVFAFLSAPFDEIDPLGGPIPVNVGTLLGVNNSTVRLHFWDGTDTYDPPTTAGAGGRFTATVPPGDAGGNVVMWATGRTLFGNRPFVTNSWTLTYSGTPSTRPDPCTLPNAVRGFLKIARSSSGDTLESNVRTGPEVKLYPSDGLIGATGQTVGCVATALSSPSTTCLSGVVGLPFARNMTDGFFNSDGGKDGRLIGDCGAGTSNVRGHDVDAMTLFDGMSPLVDNSVGSASGLRDAILSGGPVPDSDRGWIRSQALKCPRLAVMPVMDPNPISGVAGQKILKLSYVWIDNIGSGRRGLNFSGGRLQSFQGYVIDPKLLPDLVAGSPVVGPYLGPDMPKEALLIPDLPSP